MTMLVDLHVHHRSSYTFSDGDQALLTGSDSTSDGLQSPARARTASKTSKVEDYLAKDIARLHFLQSFMRSSGPGSGFYVTTLKLRHFENVFFGLIASSGRSSPSPLERQSLCQANPN